MHTLCHSVLMCPSQQRAASQTANQRLLAQHNTDHRAYNLESLQYYLRGPQNLYRFSIKHSPEKQCFAAKSSHVFRQQNQPVSIYSFKILHFKETISLHILVRWSLCALSSHLWLPCSHLPKQSEDEMQLRKWLCLSPHVRYGTSVLWQGFPTVRKCIHITLLKREKKNLKH